MFLSLLTLLFLVASAVSGNDSLCKKDQLERVLCCLTVKPPVSGEVTVDQGAAHYCLPQDETPEAKHVCNFLNIIGNLSKEMNAELIATAQGERERRCHWFGDSGYKSLFHSPGGKSHRATLPSTKEDWTSLICDANSIKPLLVNTKGANGKPKITVNNGEIQKFLKDGQFTRVFYIADVIKKLDGSYRAWAESPDSYYARSKYQLTAVVGNYWKAKVPSFEPAKETAAFEQLWNGVTQTIFARYQDCVSEAVEDVTVSLAWTLMNGNKQ